MALEQTSLDDLRTYARDIWKSGKGEVLIQGNFDQSEATGFVDMIDSVLAFDSVQDSQLPERLRALPLPIIPLNGTAIKLKVLEPNPSNINAVSHVSIQALGKSDSDHVIVEILAAILNEPFYEDLRTKQQVCLYNY
jgi:insulysin